MCTHCSSTLSLCSYCACAIVLLLTSITATLGTAKKNHIQKRSVDGNFDVLLNLYKFNPLKRSKIFKAFSNRMLIPNRADSNHDLHFDSNESAKERQTRIKVNLKQIEETIHVTQRRHKDLERPYFTVNDYLPERFSEELTLDDVTRYKKFKAKKDDYMLENILEHIGSNELSSTIKSKDIGNQASRSTKTVSVHEDDKVNRIETIVNNADLNRSNHEYNYGDSSISKEKEVEIMR